MSDDKEFDIVIEATDPEHLAAIHELFGAAKVLDDLQAAKNEYDGAPGLGLALALAEKTVADLRADMAGYSLRAAQSAGYDIVKHRRIVTTIRDGKPVLMMKSPQLL